MSMDLDLGIDEEDAEESVKSGIEQGIKKGLKKGAAEGIAPLAQEAGKVAIEQLAGGGKSEIQGVLKDVGDAMRLTALQKTLDTMGKKPETPTTPVNQTNQFTEMIKSMAQFGVKPNDLVGQMGITNLMGMMNPQIIPYLSLMNQNKPQGGNSQQEMLPLLMMMMQQQQNQPQQQQQPQKNDGLVAALMQQQQQLMQQLFQIQQDNAKLQQQTLYEQFKPFLEHPPSFGDQMEQLQGQIKGLKTMGFLGPQKEMSDRALDLDFEAKKMAIQLERDKMQFDRQLELEKQRLMQQDKQNDMYMKFAETGQNLIKNLNIERRPPRPKRQQSEEQEQIPEAVEENTTLSDQISDRISHMLRVNKDG